MRSPFLFLALLAAPLPFIGPAEAGILPACCVIEGEAHPGDPPHLENPPRFLAPVEVRRRDQRALVATAEAPIPVEVPLADAIGFPLEAPAEAIEPGREPVRAVIVEPPPLRAGADVPPVPDGLIWGPPCCQVEGETHPPDHHSEDAPLVLLGAEIRRGYDRALEAAVEVAIPAQAPLVDAIGFPLGERPGVSEPAHVPVSLDNRAAFVAPRTWLRAIQVNVELGTALFVILLAIGFWLIRRSRRRRPPPELEPFAVPVSRPPLPEALLRLLESPVAPEREPVC